ncbi:Ig-like domain-containing protein [Dryocola clanedunensis]|uniref:Ig-like domain-containing protein n=1 Tax=Cedecea sulfonylureivorans TaxID=3051154 RepID=UPI001928011D|nr:Ig-like domain-containing protein [Cedecea sulfonylureivorans]
MTDYTSSTRDAALLAGLLANLPTDNGQLIPTPAEPGVINIDTVSDNQGLHTGTVDNFGFTDDLTPTLSGNAGAGGAGTVIQFCINTVLVGSAVVNSDGSWSFTPDQPLEANHEYIFQSVVQDGGSKQFLISLPYTIITTDSNADISVSATLDSVVDNVSDYNGAVGALKEGGLTNDARPELTGHATAGATVNIYDNGVLLATTTAKADGSWTYTPSSALTNGTHNLAVSATGATGESKPTAAFRIVVDTTAIKPVVDSATDDQGAITGNLAGGSLTDDSRPVLHGYAEPNTRVDVHVFGPNGKELYYDSVTSNADGTWDYQARAFTTQGTYSFGISSIDQAGNAWRDYGTKFTLKYVGSNQDDTTAPDAATNLVLNDNVGSIKGEIHSQGLTDDSTPTLTGKAEAGTTVVVSDNGVVLGSATVAANGTWSFTPSPALADGLHSITTVVKDAAGQSSTVSDAITFTVDSHIDAPTITGYQDDVGVSTGAVENGGRTDDNNGVLSGHAEAGSIISLTMWGPRGVKYGNVAHAVADGDGNWHIQLSDGSRLLGARGNWTFQVTAVDEAGNRANSDQFKVNYVASNQDDITAPDTPVIADYTDNVGASTGNQASGTVTDDTTPMLNGHAEAGSLVKIYEGNTLLGSVAAGSNGDWHFTPPARSEGSHTFTATATDAAGNTSEATVGFVVKIDVPDTTPPTAPAITDVYDDVGTTTGKVVSGGKTDDLQPKLNGTGEPGSHISITMTGPVSGKIHTIATVTVGADGTWHYQFVGGQALQAGNNVFHTTATDAAGNTAAGNDFSVKLVGSNQDGNDTTPPVAPHITGAYDDVGTAGNIKSGGTTDDTTPKLSGTAEANSVVKIYDNNVAIGSTTANSSGSWSYTPAGRSEGSHTFTATATDAAGNASGKSGGYVVNIDVPDPGPGKASITSVYDDVGPNTGNVANGGTTDDTTVTLTGKATPGSTLYVYADGKGFDTVHANSQGVWTSTVTPRTDGQHVFTAREVKGGTLGAESNSWVVNVKAADTTPPTAPVITDVYDDVGTTTGKVVSGGKTDDLQPKLNGTGEPGSHISITMTGPVSGKIHTIATVTVGADGTWHYQFVGGQALQAGNNVFHTTATDAAGNTAAGNDFSVKLVGSNQDGNDTTPPAAPHIVSGYDDVNISTAIGKFYSGDTIDDTTPKLSGTAEANSVVKIYDNNVAIGSTTANSSGSWSYTTPARSEGKHTFSATATDAAGNTSGKSGGFVVNVDVPNPVVKHIESFEGTEIPSHFYNLTTQTGVHITSSAGLYLLTTPGVLVDSVNGTHVLGGGNFAREQAISVSLPGASETVFVNLQTQSISGIRFYDASGLQIHATMKDTGRAGGDLQLHRYEFTADAGHSISSFTVSASYIDTIEWHNSTSYSTMINHQNPLSQMMVQADDEQASSGSTEIINHLSQDVLHLTLNDILSEAHDNLFIQDGNKQLAVTGDAGDVVELKVEDLAHNTWQDAGQVTAGGVQYEVYQHAGSDVELLVQQGMELHQVS